MFFNRTLFNYLFTAVIGCLQLFSCQSENNQSQTAIKKYLQTADSLALVGKTDTAVAFLLSNRYKFKTGDPQLSAYYEFLSLRFHLVDTALATCYADSALMVFNNPENIDKYPGEYFKALIAKGDAYIGVKQYESALAYYDKAKRRLADGSCDNGNLASKIGGIYFNQKNYAMAARYWVESYSRLQKCSNTVSPQRLFYLTQAALNNTGVSYERACNYDSAYYYYKADLDLIDKAEQNAAVDKSNIEAPRVVVYDNIGGLYLRQGRIQDAERYLAESVAIPVGELNGIRITPYLKLAELYLQTNELDKALNAFKESRRLLAIYGKDNPVPMVEWNQLYARYLFARQQPVAAFQYQAKYIRLKDSIEKTNDKLHRLDVNRELKAIQRETLLAQFEHKEKVEHLYTIGATIVAILLLGIIISINRVLKESRAKHSSARLNNEQLKQTLEELERANKNIVRIMRVMAHDLRNPLAGMIGLAKSAADGGMTEESKHLLKLLEDTGTQSLAMINELLHSGLADDEKEVMLKDEVDVTELLRDSVALLQFRAGEKKQQITFEGSADPIIAHINKEKIWRVFNNLIVNAIKFSYNGGMIFVSIKKTPHNKILIAIADNGMGIADKDKESVFDMFTAAKRVGTNGEQPFGLGLSISKRIIDNHDGRLWFESSAGFGTTFYVELPLI
jgi:signal transduction histidine kinase